MSDKIWDIITWLLVVIGTLIAIRVTVAMRNSQEQPIQYNGFRSWNEYNHCKRLHKFHGTDSSEKDIDGSWVFYREGQKCALWNPMVRSDY